MAGRKPAVDRVLSRCVETPSGCWEYQGARGHRGHGYVSDKGKQCYAHRVVYEALVVDIPDGLHLDHLCQNPPCVNPQHLDPVTPRVNGLRGDTPQSRNAKKTHCPQGHPYSGENLHVKNRRRIGKTCRRAADLQRYYRRKARA